MTFKPCYTWPNPAIPFRVYIDLPDCRIFIIENLQHNFNWLVKYKDKFRSSDHFVVIVGCHYHKWLVEEAASMFSALSLSKDNFHILYNDLREKLLFEACGFSGDIINQNAWLDERDTMTIMPVDKLYDCIYVARLMELKRHYLCSSVKNLALVAGDLHGATQSNYVPPHVYRNENALNPSEVCLKINQSHCGLILSESEGSSFVSSEYLLCGIPVVSTFSEGGRDVWYDDYNSLLVEPDPSKVAQAVDYFSEHPRDPEIIRNNHIKKASMFRHKFINLINSILLYEGIDYINVERYFYATFFHKMRTCFVPEFDKIFC